MFGHMNSFVCGLSFLTPWEKNSKRRRREHTNERRRREHTNLWIIIPHAMGEELKEEA